MSENNSTVETMKQVFLLAGQGRLDHSDLQTVAKLLTDVGNFPVAVQLYREWLNHTTSPFVSNVYCDLGDALLALKDKAGAEQAFNRCLELFPEYPRAKAGLTKCR